MALLLGVDTGGTYTDAVILDDADDCIIASSKSLTTRPDLSQGVGAVIDAVLEGQNSADISMVSLSTTLATNALVEGQGDRIALVFIGFTAAELSRAGLEDALDGDPVIHITGGHNYLGEEESTLDLSYLESVLLNVDPNITSFAVASSFATRNPTHENAARDMIRKVTGKPVTCSHELSSALGGPKRALTAVLNARLIGMIDALITAVESHMKLRGLPARLMVVRGDGALVSAALAREKPIETILSGPAASVAGAKWITDETNALVADIGGTTTDVCLLRGGKPKIDPKGARVGPYRTMVEAVAMYTTGLGGDSEVQLAAGLSGELLLGPRRLMPIALAAQKYPNLVHGVFDQALAQTNSTVEAGLIVIPLWDDLPQRSDAKERAIIEELKDGPQPYNKIVTTRMKSPILRRLASQGVVMFSGVTPSDAAHVLNLSNAWDQAASEKALALFARRRTGSGQKLAESADTLAQMIIDQLTAQTVDCVLDAAFAEDDRKWDQPSADLTRHALTKAGLDQHSGVVETSLKLGVPVIGLGASAKTYYEAVGKRLNTPMILPDHGAVANAIGAVVGQISMRMSGTITSPNPEQFVVHVGETPLVFRDQKEAFEATETLLRDQAAKRAEDAGIGDVQFFIDQKIEIATIENQEMFIEAVLHVTAKGRPRLTDG